MTAPNADYVLANLMPGDGITLMKNSDGSVTAWVTIGDPFTATGFILNSYFTDDSIESAVAGLEKMYQESDPDKAAQIDSSGARS